LKTVEVRNRLLEELWNTNFRQFKIAVNIYSNYSEPDLGLARLLPPVYETLGWGFIEQRSLAEWLNGGKKYLEDNWETIRSLTEDWQHNVENQLANLLRNTNSLALGSASDSSGVHMLVFSRSYLIPILHFSSTSYLWKFRLKGPRLAASRG
jgi:hypothetical protein